VKTGDTQIYDDHIHLISFLKENRLTMLSVKKHVVLDEVSFCCNVQ
jgi:hypothetical protein